MANEPTTEIISEIQFYLNLASKEQPTLLIQTLMNAADRLESQQREIAELTVGCETMYQEMQAMIDCHKPLHDQLDAEKARADAAVADMKNFCQFCEHYDLEEGEEPCASCMCTDIENKKPSKWVWRGEKGRATE